VRVCFFVFLFNPVVLLMLCLLHCIVCSYSGAGKSLARPNWKNNWKFANFRPTWRSLLPRRPCWMDNLLNFFLRALQNLEIGRWSLFPSWSGKGLISILVKVC